MSPLKRCNSDVEAEDVSNIFREPSEETKAEKNQRKASLIMLMHDFASSTTAHGLGRIASADTLLKVSNLFVTHTCLKVRLKTCLQILFKNKWFLILSKR